MMSLNQMPTSVGAPIDGRLPGALSARMQMARVGEQLLCELEPFGDRFWISLATPESKLSRRVFKFMYRAVNKTRKSTRGSSPYLNTIAHLVGQETFPKDTRLQGLAEKWILHCEAKAEFRLQDMRDLALGMGRKLFPGEAASAAAYATSCFGIKKDSHNYASVCKLFEDFERALATGR